MIKKGDRVTLKGLKAGQYNGKHGTVVSLPCESKDGRYGIKVDGSNAPIGIKPINIQLLPTASAATASKVTKTTAELKKERDELLSLTTRSKEETANTEQMAMMRMMMNMFMTEEHQIKAYGRMIEPMHNFPNELIMEEGGYPIGVDHAWAKGYLNLAYEQASSLPHMFELYFKQPDFKPDPKDLMKRLCTNDSRKLEWYFSGSPGSIFTDQEVRPYSDCFRHSYSNQAYRKEQLQQGKTHVAVGFVDLGLLLAADMNHGPSESNPFHFLGVEMSAYSVAKTHVIWELIRGRKLPSQVDVVDQARIIMQVWFSTTWCNGTQSAVKAVLSHLCQPMNKYHPEVQRILEHWLNSPSVSIEQARKENAANLTDAHSSIGCLKRKKDRKIIGVKIVDCRLVSGV